VKWREFCLGPIVFLCIYGKNIRESDATPGRAREPAFAQNHQKELTYGNPEKVILKIVSVKGSCAAGHKEGRSSIWAKIFTLGLSGNPGVILPERINAILSLMASAAAWGRIPLGGGQGEDVYCVPGSTQSRGDRTPKDKRVGGEKAAIASFIARFSSW